MLHPPTTICNVRRKGKGGWLILSKNLSRFNFNLLTYSFFNGYLSPWDSSGHPWLWNNNPLMWKSWCCLSIRSFCKWYHNHGFSNKFLKVSVLKGAGCVVSDHGRWGFWTTWRIQPLPCLMPLTEVASHAHTCWFPGGRWFSLIIKHRLSCCNVL